MAKMNDHFLQYVKRLFILNKYYILRALCWSQNVDDIIVASTGLVLTVFSAQCTTSSHSTPRIRFIIGFLQVYFMVSKRNTIHRHQARRTRSSTKVEDKGNETSNNNNNSDLRIQAKMRLEVACLLGSFEWKPCCLSSLDLSHHLCQLDTPSTPQANL